MLGLSSRFWTSTRCGRTSPLRSIALAMYEYLGCGHAGAAPRQRPTPPLTRGGFVWELGSRPKGRWLARGSERGTCALIPPPSRHLLLGVQLDYQLLLRGDGNVRPLRALQHSPAVRVAVDGEPRRPLAAGRLLHRLHHE